MVGFPVERSRMGLVGLAEGFDCLIAVINGWLFREFYRWVASG